MHAHRIAALGHHGRQALLLVALAAFAASARAESTLGNQKSERMNGSAHLEFTIIIPPMMILDAKTGMWRSNDKRMRLVPGTITQLGSRPAVVQSTP